MAERFYLCRICQGYGRVSHNPNNPAELLPQPSYVSDGTSAVGWMICKACDGRGVILDWPLSG